MKVKIVDLNTELIDQLNKDELKNLVTIEAIQGNILKHFDGNCTVVSPANSFGFMNGGVDAAYTGYFGAIVQEKVQQYIKSICDGELLVGQAIHVETNNRDCPWLICAPTMRTPRPIKNYEDVYLASRAAMRKALWLEDKFGIETVIFPGMGTATGKVPLYIAAQCMYNGIKDAIDGVKFPKSWYEAQSEMMFITGQI